jgi:phosphoribosylanthranilate isomerase
MTDGSRVRAKICGLTRTQDVLCAIRSGADAIGFVFYPPSPRAVTAEQAAELAQHATAFVQLVGLFVNASAAEIQQVLDVVPLDILQLHGDESPEQCQIIATQTKKRWIKALAVKPEMNIAEIIQQYAAAGASAILLDAWHPQLKGGTGQTFDWTQWPITEIPLVLAGGLTPDNVSDAIQQTRPYAVDVSGGVEASKGIKDAVLIQQFMQAVLQ